MRSMPGTGWRGCSDRAACGGHRQPFPPPHWPAGIVAGPLDQMPDARWHLRILVDHQGDMIAIDCHRGGGNDLLHQQNSRLGPHAPCRQECHPASCSPLRLPGQASVCTVPGRVVPPRPHLCDSSCNTRLGDRQSLGKTCGKRAVGHGLQAAVGRAGPSPGIAS